MATLDMEDIWQSWPLFVEDYYEGKHPEWQTLADEYTNDFVHWLITNKNYAFHQAVGNKKAMKWIRSWAGVTVTRRILEWKYIQLTEHGRDIFADPGTKEYVLRMAQEGKFRLWDYMLPS